MSINFNDLRKANLQRQQEWDAGDKISLTYSTTELAGETGEFCNEVKKLERERLGLVGSRTNLEKLRKEAADIAICLDLVCMRLGIDLAEAVKEKFNETSEKNGFNTKL